jgi:chromosome segregation ATPase
MGGDWVPGPVPAMGASMNGSENEHKTAGCYDRHDLLSRRVGDVESEVRIIKSQFSGLEREVNQLSTIMCTIQKNTNETNAAMQRLAAEVGGIKTVMEIRHDYEAKIREGDEKRKDSEEKISEKKGVMTYIKNAREILLLVAVSGSLFTGAWVIFKVAHKSLTISPIP